MSNTNTFVLNREGIRFLAESLESLNDVVFSEGGEEYLAPKQISVKRTLNAAISEATKRLREGGKAVLLEKQWVTLCGDVITDVCGEKGDPAKHLLPAAEFRAIANENLARYVFAAAAERQAEAVGQGQGPGAG